MMNTRHRKTSRAWDQKSEVNFFAEESSTTLIQGNFSVEFLKEPQCSFELEQDSDGEQTRWNWIVVV